MFSEKAPGYTRVVLYCHIRMLRVLSACLLGFVDLSTEIPYRACLEKERCRRERKRGREGIPRRRHSRAGSNHSRKKPSGDVWD